MFDIPRRHAMTQKELQALVDAGAASVKKNKDGKILEVRRHEKGRLTVYKADSKGDK
jgi:hypothetical protein